MKLTDYDRRKLFGLDEALIDSEQGLITQLIRALEDANQLPHGTAAYLLPFLQGEGPQIILLSGLTSLLSGFCRAAETNLALPGHRLQISIQSISPEMDNCGNAHCRRHGYLNWPGSHRPAAGDDLYADCDFPGNQAGWESLAYALRIGDFGEPDEDGLFEDGYGGDPDEDCFDDGYPDRQDQDREDLEEDTQGDHDEDAGKEDS